MKNDLNYENAIFEFVFEIKSFNELLQHKYDFRENPYEVSGKKFSKIGTIINDEGVEIKYRFHGRGCTFFLKDREYFFNFDTTSIHNIIITVGGFFCYLKSYMPDIDDSYPIQEIMENLERKGVFMHRKAMETGVFHVNEKWYFAYKFKTPFLGENKYDCDWL